MRIIKIYTVSVNSANHYRDQNYEYFYNLADAYCYLCEFAECWKTYSVHGYDFPEIMEVGYISCNLAPVKDDITLPEDPATIFSDFDGVDDNNDPIYLSDDTFVACAVEHELPFGGDFLTLYADGHIEQTYHDGKQSKTMKKHLDDWKSRGWNGVVEEVIP